MRSVSRGLFIWCCTVLVAAGGLVADLRAAAPADEEVRDYRLWYRNYDSPAVNDLLTLAFDKTPEYGDYRILRSTEMGQGRVLLELERGSRHLVDVANVASTDERERDLYEIPIPIDGGLLGFRVCLVRGQDVEQFKGISNLGDLARNGLSIGQGTHWPDTGILRNNGVTVITHTRYETLFNMLRAGRFDCFARGINEVLFDLDHKRADGLVIEPNLLLAYPMPSYFFVGPEDHQTAQRIELGLERAIADGSFAAYLAVHYGRPLEELGLESRTLLMLRNPTLSQEDQIVGRRTLEALRERIARGKDGRKPDR